MQKYDMDGKCTSYYKMRNKYKILVRHSGDPCIYWRIVLKWILERNDVRCELD
jgi:hypothetical protein